LAKGQLSVEIGSVMEDGRLGLEYCSVRLSVVHELLDDGFGIRCHHNAIDCGTWYVDVRIDTNGCENLGSLLERTLKGTHVSVEPFRLFRHLDDQALHVEP
jgi:hypothetical protein